MSRFKVYPMRGEYMVRNVDTHAVLGWFADRETALERVNALRAAKLLWSACIHDGHLYIDLRCGPYASAKRVHMKEVNPSFEAVVRSMTIDAQRAIVNSNMSFAE